jgi:hypothetical protein
MHFVDRHDSDRRALVVIDVTQMPLPLMSGICSSISRAKREPYATAFSSLSNSIFMGSVSKSARSVTMNVKVCTRPNSDGRLTFLAR